MNLRSLSTARLMVAAVFVGAFLLAGQTTIRAQSLTTSANPPSGAAGVNNSYLTGSGFPAGTITGATVRFGAICAAPSIASAPVTQVVSIGTLRRFQFLIPASLAPGSYKVWLTGTAGTTAFNTLNTPSCSSITVSSSVQGTASVGAAIISGAVTLVDANGNSVSGTTASDGTFALASGGLTPPYLVRIVLATAAGPYLAGTTLYSVSADGNTSTHINVNVLTDTMLRTFYNAEGINPDAAFANPTGVDAAPSPTAVESLANLFIPAIQLWTNNDGLTLTGDAPANGALNLITSPYAAFPPGVPPPPGSLDLLLHQIIAETSNSDGSVSALTISGGGTITETINPTTANDLITLTTTTTDSSNPNSGSSASFSALALTNTLQPVIDGLNALLTLFKNIVNSRGAALTGSDLLPLYSMNYLDSGRDRIQASIHDASELSGATVNSLTVAGIRSFDPATMVADVIIASSFSFNGQTESGTDNGGNFFKLENGNWVQYGNQRVGDFSANVSARTFQPFGGNGVFMNAFADTPAGRVTNVIVSGPTENAALHIWPGNLGAATLTQGAQQVENGELHDTFFTLSNDLRPGQGTAFQNVTSKVPPGSTFVFIVSTTNVGTPQYVEHSNAITTEMIQFTSFNGAPVPAAPPTGHLPLSAVVNQTVNVTFTTPQTFAVSRVSVSAEIFDGPPNLTTSHGCFVDGQNSVTLNANHTGSASITFPANMSVCGLNSNAIQAVQIFLEADGVNGEQSSGFIAIPW
jgi:hypothetical protein